VIDSDLTLELEDRYATFREEIKSGASLGTVREEAADVRAGLTEFESKLEDPNVGAGSLAFLSSFTIIFREGLEAVLVLAALLGFLAAADRRRYRRPVVAGTAAAAVASVATFVVLGLALKAAPLQRELLEAVMTLVAVLMLFAVSFWLLQRIEHRHWMEFVRARLLGATARGSAIAVGLVGFTAVFREGFETVLFYQALLFYSGSVLHWVVAGFAAGVLALGAVGWGILRLRRRLPVRQFLTAAVAMVMLLSVAFAGNAVNQLQNLDLLPATSLRDEIPRLPVALAELTGIHPTVESLASQIGLLIIYAGGLAIVRLTARRRAAAMPAAAQAEVGL
jgi:high-affinity iron transporter